LAPRRLVAGKARSKRLDLRVNDEPPLV